MEKLKLLPALDTCQYLDEERNASLIKKKLTKDIIEIYKLTKNRNA